MSKSLGNSEDAVDAAGRMGADVLRLVYASLDYTSDITLGQTIFNAVSESYRKIRNTCRFVLGNLADFDPARDAVELNDMLEFDRFILARTEKLKSEVRRAYDAFEFQTAFQVMQNFIVVDLSSLYIDVARDRLYCAAEKSRERRSAQTALFHILDALRADARAADSVHRRGSLLVSAGQAARQRASDYDASGESVVARRRISKRDGSGCSRFATRRSSCSRRCARRARSARRSMPRSASALTVALTAVWPKRSSAIAKS